MTRRLSMGLETAPLVALTTLINVAVAENTGNLMPDHSKVPGVVIDYSPASSGKYIGSPSIAVLPNGHYVASHDLFGPKTPFRTEAESAVFLSRDKGKTWQKTSTIKPLFWGKLFVHKGALYILGAKHDYGPVVIRRSTDGGRTWTSPTDASSGLLLPDRQYHCAAVPVVVHRGYIWRAMEERNPPEGWGANFRTFVMSARVDSDLLNAANWRTSNRLRYNPSWPGFAWLEGNIAITPQGKMVIILRNHTDEGGKAAMVEVSADGKNVHFDPETGFIDFPGGCKKFTIRYDSQTKHYWSLTNWIHPTDRGGNAERTRNTLALISSKDLRNWLVNRIVLRDPDVKKTGFQYADWHFEGADIIAVLRTAFDDGVGGAHNCHDANYLTFHRIQDFRTTTARR